MPVQMAGTLLDFLAPQMQSLVDGTSAGGPGGAAATSAAAFGMPDVAVPPMPPAGQHGGSGAAPGPGNSQQITIDQSIHGNVGWDPAEAAKKRDEGLARAIPRIPPR
jgi:hypothetical protein